MFALIASSVFHRFASLSPSSGSAAVCSFSSGEWVDAVLKSTGSFATQPNIASNGVCLDDSYTALL